MPLATPIPNDCADRDKKSGGLLSVAGGPGENDGASGTAGTKKRKVVDEGDDALDGLLRSSPKERLPSGSGSGHCHYPPHPGWWNGGFGNYASPHPHQCQNDAAPLLLQQCQRVLIDNRWVQINGHPGCWMTVQVWKNVSTPINQPQWMLLNNVWVWMCVHGMEEHEAEESARWIAFYEENEAEKKRVAAEKEAKKADLEERQRLKADKEAKRKADLEEWQRLKAEKVPKRKAKLEKQQRLKAEKVAKRKAKLEVQTEWHHNHQEIIRRLQQTLSIYEEGDESTRKKLQKKLELQEELLQKLDDERDERKRSNLKVGLEYSGRLLKERIEETGDEQTKKQLDGYLKTEYTQLLETAIGTAIHQNKYLKNLERRKKSRGHSESEEYQKKFQRMNVAKKAFDKTVKAVQHKQIEEEFPELKELIRATADGCSDDTEFSEEDAAAMAGEKVKEMLTLLAKDAKISVDDILPPDMTLEEFLKIDRKDKDAMNRLRRLAMKEAEKKGEPLLDAEAIEQADIERFGELSFLTCLQILIYHDDIVDGVVQKKVGAIRHPTSHKWLFFACIPNELIAHFCIGSIVIEGLDLEDFERVIRIKGKYVIQLFGGEEYIRLYRVTETSIERVSFNVTTTDNLFKFVCTTQRDKSFDSEKKYAGEKQWSLHRLEQVVLFNLDLGMNKCEWFRDYFGLKGSETFEEKLSYYKYDPDAAKRRRARLELKGWENVRQAVQCDVDHLIGRMHMWMNASIFGMPCSHSWNQCMGNVRQRMGCWGFAFATIEYNGGN